MVHALVVLLAMLGNQDAKDRPKPADDDKPIPGLPDGEIAPLPDRVKWETAASISSKTATRERLDLSGYWRFAAVDGEETPVKRAEMGWIDGPALPAEDGNNVFDIRFRGSDGLWRGKPIESYPFVWIERDVQITNADVLEWLNRRVFLVVTGSWAEAEIFTSQRLAKPRKDATDDANELVVHAEPVGGDERSGARWCDITEHLLYPGSTQLSFRLKRDKNSTDNSPASAPSITIERWPTGCRVNTIQVHRASEPSSIQATFNLERPAGYMIVGMPAVRTIPLMLKVQLESIDSNKELANITKEIGPLADLKRTVTMNIPWMSQDGATPSRLRLRVQLTMTNGVVFDEPFPLEFRPGELESAGK